MNAAKTKPNAKRNERRAVVSAQQTIPYVAMHPDGICQLPGGLYTKTVEYEDINYAVASTEDQTAIFGGWSSFLNYFDSSLPFQLSFVNRRSRSANRYKVSNDYKRCNDRDDCIHKTASEEDRESGTTHDACNILYGRMLLFPVHNLQIFLVQQLLIGFVLTNIPG